MQVSIPALCLPHRDASCSCLLHHAQSSNLSQRDPSPSHIQALLVLITLLNWTSDCDKTLIQSNSEIFFFPPQLVLGFNYGASFSALKCSSHATKPCLFFSICSILTFWIWQSFAIAAWGKSAIIILHQAWRKGQKDIVKNGEYMSCSAPHS